LVVYGVNHQLHTAAAVPPGKISCKILSSA